MSKTKRIIKKEKNETGLLATFQLENVLPEKYHLPVALVVFLLLFLIFLNPLYFGGKTTSATGK